MGVDYVDLGLSRVVAELDVQGAEIIEHQKETFAERKKLAELTKGLSIFESLEMLK